jgi:branched-chain amino acid transport system ATP-binding protein
MLSVNGLQAHYGSAKILHNVSFDADVGEVVALLGRNGAGKSTTMKAVMGLVPPSGGEVKFAGEAINGRMPYQIARLGLGYVPEERRIFTSLTVEENLRMGRRPPRAGASAWTPDRLYALFPNLAEMSGRKGSQISGGEQQMLTISRTLMGNPSAILLDEPSEGLAPKIVEQMAHAILSIKASGVAIVLSEQNMHFASLVSDRAYVIEKGQVRYTGTMAELKNNDEIRRNYLAL